MMKWRRHAEETQEEKADTRKQEVVGRKLNKIDRKGDSDKEINSRTYIDN